MPAATAPLDDIRAIIADLPPPDRAAAAALRESRLASPPAELGAFDAHLQWLAEWQGRDRPTANRAQLVVFAGNHGVASNGPQGATASEVAALAKGATTLNRLCHANGIGLKAFDLALETATADFATRPAMSEAECAATIAFGMEAAAGNVDLLAVAGIGEGSAIAATALGRSLFGDAVRSWLDEGAPPQTQKALADAIALHACASGDPLEAARRLGGRETAAIIGAIVAARVARVPVLIDGLAATAAAGVLYATDPSTIDHCRFAQASTSEAHRRLLGAMGARTVIETRPAGTGIGSVLAIAALKAMAAGA